MRCSILAPLTAAAVGLLVACSESGSPTAPTAAPNAAVAATVTCAATSPVQQINAVIAFIRQHTAISAAFRTQIVGQLQSVTTLLAQHRPAAAITQLRALITRIQASSLLATLKQALIARINCIIAALTR
jgi:hypothetical protein